MPLNLDLGITENSERLLAGKKNIRQQQLKIVGAWVRVEEVRVGK